MEKHWDCVWRPHYFCFPKEKEMWLLWKQRMFWRIVLIKDSFHFVLGIFYCPLLVFINVRKCPWWGLSRTVAFCFSQGLLAQCSAHLHSHKADAQFHQIRAAAFKAQCPGCSTGQEKSIQKVPELWLFLCLSPHFATGLGVNFQFRAFLLRL